MVYETACERITVIAVNRDGMNDAADGGPALPPVIRHDLIGLRAAAFLRLMRQFSSRLDLSFKPDYIDKI